MLRNIANFGSGALSALNRASPDRTRSGPATAQLDLITLLARKIAVSEAAREPVLHAEES